MSKSLKIISFDLSQIDKAIAKLEKVKADIHSKNDILVRELAEEGAKVADAIFQSVPSSEQGSTTQVTVASTGDSQVITASGEGVAFVEFGTGVLTSPYQVESSTIPIGMDEWSKRHAMQFHENGYWFYAGHRMNGTPAYKPMITASRAIKHIASNKAKEVFSR